ncbi:unnamed protein product [Pipistrellus nathusii]|uniref:Uncharacterized protein n=1 Tax=Pipistrellus nathusii TaxID=59473 RepID=A0ABN9ZXJ5_PIPNA
MPNASKQQAAGKPKALRQPYYLMHLTLPALATGLGVGRAQVEAIHLCIALLAGALAQVSLCPTNSTVWMDLLCQLVSSFPSPRFTHGFQPSSAYSANWK